MRIADILRERDVAVARVAVLESQMRDLEQQLRVAERAREALAGQLLLTERRAASDRPLPDARPCRHCGAERLSRQHLIAAGHTFEAAP